MKKQLILSLALFVMAFSFAQKKELKTLVKAVKNSNYAEAKTALSQLEPMLSTMDDKSKAKYYLNKGKAFFANGAGSGKDVMVAVESLGEITGSDFSDEVSDLKKLMQNDLLVKGDKLLFKDKNFKEAEITFVNLYKIVPSDAEYLYYAAYSALQAQDYDNALKHYAELKDIGYTGAKTEYFAVNKETGEEEVFDKGTRDAYIKLKTHISPGERQSESRAAGIFKNIAFIYEKQGKFDKQLEIIKESRVLEPENTALILSEADLYLKLKDVEKFKALMKEAVKMQPNNPVLHYNIGVINMGNKDLSGARESFKKTLSLDPSHADAALNLSTSYIDQGNGLIEQMNALGSSKSDNLKYDELKAEKASLFQVGADILEAFIAKNANADASIGQQLFNIYNALGNSDKANAVKSKFGL